jgi:hypothetical protein
VVASPRVSNNKLNADLSQNMEMSGDQNYGEDAHVTITYQEEDP